MPMITSVVKRIALAGTVAAVVSAGPTAVLAETMNFKLLPRYSRATFKSDAPMETFIGTTADAGITATLAVDPAKPQDAKGVVKVDMNQVRTGIDKRDADMRSKQYLDTDVDANRWITFQVTKVEISGPLVPGKEAPAKIHGVLTVKQKPVERVADARVMYLKLTPEQAEAQKRFGFASDNIKVKAKFATTFTDHGMQVPQLLLFLKVNNELELETDLVFSKE
jgi:polyisoprenoid-binding protein YceI